MASWLFQCSSSHDCTARGLVFFPLPSCQVTSVTQPILRIIHQERDARDAPSPSSLFSLWLCGPFHILFWVHSTFQCQQVDDLKLIISYCGALFVVVVVVGVPHLIFLFMRGIDYKSAFYDHKFREMDSLHSMITYLAPLKCVFIRFCIEISCTHPFLRDNSKMDIFYYNIL